MRGPMDTVGVSESSYWDLQMERCLTIVPFEDMISLMKLQLKITQHKE